MRKQNFIMLAILCGFFLVQGCGQRAKTEESCSEPIKIAVQAWSFNKFTFEEAAEKASKIGFKYMEMYSGQTIKKGSDATTSYDMSEENRALVKSILKKNDLQVVQYGVITCNSKEEWIKLFDFAKAMGIETINSEPEFGDFSLLDSLTQAYVINVAVHNHATGTRYYDPQIVLDQISDKGPGLGFCADNGHWMRSGLDPVEMLKKTRGRLFTMHIKDMNDFNDLEAHTVPFGSGVLDAEALIAELKHQNFRGVLTVENEYNWKNPEPDLKATLAFLREHLTPNE